MNTKPLFNILTTLVLIAALSFSACKKDDTPTDPDYNYFQLQLDGNNLASPFLLAGVFESAVRFKSNLTTDMAGGELTEVEFFLLELPRNCQIKIYTNSDGDKPKDLIHEEDITTGRTVASWNKVTLKTPVKVKAGEDIWIAIKYEQTQEQRTVGCDTGPAVTDGDWTWDSFDNEWKTLRVRTSNGTDINWNIRGTVRKEK